AGRPRFADWGAAAPALGAGARSLVWALLALGFAAKAGAVPLHVWLPLAHPAAPSHVSALMSGVMFKLGIYGLLRASFVWLAPALPWWGATLLLVGAISAVAGVLYAIVDRDLKRLLAFSSIENVGIVLVGTGAALTFAATSMAGLALLALAAALYHVVNHAAFKSLLFMAAGGVLHGTGTRDMEALGGLIRRQPRTRRPSRCAWRWSPPPSRARRSRSARPASSPRWPWWRPRWCPRRRRSPSAPGSRWRSPESSPACPCPPWPWRWRAASSCRC